GQELGARDPLPAVGFAAGFERLLLALAAQRVSTDVREAPEVFLVSVGAEAEEWVFGEAQLLREAGLRVTFDENGRSVKAQFREANRRGTPWVVVVGERELSVRQAQVKNMATGSEYTVAFDTLPDFLAERSRSHSDTT
ncbi:MAG TPA: His/Gly/Thr/Pro-type tRNA ligase C-terminal domain-containing protein, partial [Rhodothermia bacterium]|nr:His/Gly/Thr/Pro-type tRNA ligase C-terminal domain-containing protein [Rhodothermia bacterium]